MPKIKKIIPGEKYLVRQWDDMAAEYGLYPAGGDIKCPGVFMPGMKYLCGTLVTAPQVLRPSGCFRIPQKDDPDEDWFISPHMLEPAIWNVNGDD